VTEVGGVGAVVFEKVGDSWILRQRGLSGSVMALSQNGHTALMRGARGVIVYAVVPAILDVPTLGGPGLAILTLALIAAALIFLRRRRSI